MAEVVQSFRDLAVWQKGMELTEQAYRLTAEFPGTEEYPLTSQLTRAAACVPANIAEGHARGTRSKEFANFVSVARGSLAELAETFLLLAVRLRFITSEQAQPTLALIEGLSKMLTALRRRLGDPPSPSPPNPCNLFPVTCPLTCQR